MSLPERSSLAKHARISENRDPISVSAASPLTSRRSSIGKAAMLAAGLAYGCVGDSSDSIENIGVSTQALNQWNAPSAPSFVDPTANESRPFVIQNGAAKKVLFQSTRSGSQGIDLWVTDAPDGVTFGAPQKISGANTAGNEYAPVFCPAAECGVDSLFYSSTQFNGTDANIGKCDFNTTTNVATNCAELGGTVSEDFEDEFPSAVNGGFLYYATTAGGGSDFEIYRASIGVWTGLPVSGLNTAVNDSAVIFANDGKILVTTNGQVGNLGQSDIYQFDDITGTNPININNLPGSSVINTSLSEGVGSMDTDGDLWGSRTLAGKVQIFQSEFNGSMGTGGAGGTGGTGGSVEVGGSTGSAGSTSSTGGFGGGVNTGGAGGSGPFECPVTVNEISGDCEITACKGDGKVELKLTEANCNFMVRPQGVSTATTISLSGTCTPYLTGSEFHPNDCDTWYVDHPKDTDAPTTNVFYTLANGSELKLGLLGTKVDGAADLNSDDPKITVRLDQDQLLASVNDVPIQGMDTNKDGKDDQGIIEEGMSATFSLKDASLLGQPITPPPPKHKEDCQCDVVGNKNDQMPLGAPVVAAAAAVSLLRRRNRRKA